MKQIIDIEKYLISVFWFVNEIHNFIDVPKVVVYNIALLCNVVMLSFIIELYSHPRRRSLKGLYIHLDNTYAHNSRQSRRYLEAIKAQRMMYPTYNSDLNPNDFFLFRYVKEKLHEFDIKDPSALKITIPKTFN
jgi:hypothetical protein